MSFRDGRRVGDVILVDLEAQGVAVKATVASYCVLGIFIAVLARAVADLSGARRIMKGV
jgi:hypothetical protein